MGRRSHTQMVAFVCVEQAGPGYRLVREPHPDRNLDKAVFAAMIRKKNQPVEPLEGAKIKIIKVSQLELRVVHSILQLYGRPAQSRSLDSGALYLGHVLQEEKDTGMLLQYLPAGAHTSAHSHSHSEIYVMLSGWLRVFLLPENATAGQFAKEVQLNSSSRNKRSLVTVPENYYHPLVALEPSLTLIVAKYDVVYDQIYGTNNNHNQTIPFSEFAARFVAPDKVSG